MNCGLGLQKNESNNDEKVDKKDAVLIYGDQKIDGDKSFKVNPKSEEFATSESGLVPKQQMDEGLDLKADKDDVLYRNKTTAQKVVGPVRFETVPRSSMDAKNNDDLVRKSQLDDKVDKVAGKGLSTFDYNQDEKNKVAKGVAAEEWGYHGAVGYAKDKDVVKKIEVGKDGGVAPLNSQGKVPSAYLPEQPSSVVTESSLDDFPQIGEENTIYIDTATGLQYVWNGLGYSQTSTNLQLGITSVTAYRGDRGKDAYEHSLIREGNPHNVTKSDVGLDRVNNTADKDKPISTDVENALKTKVEKIDGKQLSTHDFSNEKNNKLNQIEEAAQRNVQSDAYESDANSDSYIMNQSETVIVEDSFEWKEGNAQIFDVQYKVHRLIGCFVNGQRLSKRQLDPRANGYEIMPQMHKDNQVTIVYEHKVIQENIHGFKFNTQIAAPEVHPIGNSALNTSKPILQLMRRCALKDNGEVNYFYDNSDTNKKENSEDAKTDGTDGQVMTFVPRHFRQEKYNGDELTVAFSLTPFLGATEVNEFYYSSFEASVDRNESKLTSIINLNNRYRGGSNQSAWDNESKEKSQLGKAVSGISRITSERYAKNRGENWMQQKMHQYTALVCLQVLDFGTLNAQSKHVGVTTLNNTEWLNFNNRYPVVRCGVTSILGNRNGEVEVTLEDYPTNGRETKVQVPSWRGIENFYGHIFKWIGDINIINNEYYLNPVGRKRMSDVNSDGYIHIGSIPAANGYIREHYPGTILPSKLGGSSSTYMADYMWSNNDVGVRAVRSGGSGSNGARSGPFALSTNLAPTSTYAHSGARLCYER